MFKYLINRLLVSIPTLLTLITITFFVMRAVPGGPFDSEKALTPEIKANLEAKFQLDKPVSVQYLNYLRQISRGDFGPSYRFLGSREVHEIILESLPISFLIGSISIVFSILIGVPLGILSAYKQNTWIDLIVSFFCVIGTSLPSFLVASLLIFFFSIYLEWLPPALWENPLSLVLPVMTMMARPLALIMRLTRVSMIEALTSDYVRTARAKGLSEIRVLFQHALKNSLVPVVTLLGPLASAIVTGSFVVEVIFALPGLGKYYVTAVLDRDYPLIMGITIVYGIFLVLANLSVDLLYGFIDPRIREKTLQT